MIEDGITEGKYIEASDNICDLNDSKIFFIVIFINTKIMKQYFHVLISLAVFSLQLKLISLNPLKIFLYKVFKLRPIISQTGTYIYNALKVVAKYLSPLSKNEFSIKKQ